MSNNKYCPFVKDQCIGGDCIHFLPEKEYKRIKAFSWVDGEEELEEVVRPARCRLWR